MMNGCALGKVIWGGFFVLFCFLENNRVVGKYF